MKKQTRCKACGYILDEESTFSVCPACGVPRTAFEPFSDPVSEKRRKLINLHLHPIAVHFPQAFAVVIPALVILSYIVPAFNKELVSTVTVLALLLPLSVIPALATGLLDAKTRFKKLSPPFIKRKIILGSLLLILSITAAAMVLIIREESLLKLILLGVTGLCVLCEMLLGAIGGKLMDAILPG